MPAETIAEQLSAIMGRFAGKRMLVIGDLMLDEFIWGKVSRISPEAPVPVVSVTGESYYPGGAANVARNLCEFTREVAVMGRVGTDPAGSRLMAAVEAAGIDSTAVERDARFSTIVKTRIIARNQQVVRVDRERKSPLSAEQTAAAAGRLDAMIERLDGIVVADYGKGFLTQDFADHICRQARAHGKVLAVDPHPYASLAWRGATAVKPNRAEAFLAAGLADSDPVLPVCDDRPLLEAGRRLREQWQCESLLITLGENGMLLFTGQDPVYHTPTRAQSVFDVSGAGDTAIAVFALGLVAGATPPEAAELANLASGRVVGKLGTATVTLAELQASIRPV